MEKNKDDPMIERARKDYEFYSKKAKSLLELLNKQKEEMTKTIDEFTLAMQHYYEARRILEG